jgi:hypothetical protein
MLHLPLVLTFISIRKNNMKYELVNLSQGFGIRLHGRYPLVTVWHEVGAEKLAKRIQNMMNEDARSVRKAKSPALDTVEICHTAPNT